MLIFQLVVACCVCHTSGWFDIPISGCTVDPDVGSRSLKVDNINNAVRVEFTDTLPEPIEPMLSSYYDSNIMAKAIDNLDMR